VNTNLTIGESEFPL